VVISRRIADTFKERSFQAGSRTAATRWRAPASSRAIGIFKEERIVEHARALGTEVIGPELRKLADKHPSVGEVRGLGVFWALELVRDRKTRQPLCRSTQLGRDAKPMVEVMTACKAGGVWPFAHFNRLQITPPCTTNADEIREGPLAIDKALEAADKHYTG